MYRQTDRQRELESDRQRNRQTETERERDLPASVSSFNCPARGTRAKSSLFCAMINASSWMLSTTFTVVSMLKLQHQTAQTDWQQLVMYYITTAPYLQLWCHWQCHLLDLILPRWQDTVCTHWHTLVSCHLVLHGCTSRLRPWATTFLYIHFTAVYNSTGT